MGKSIAAERTWPIRLLALAAALGMVVTGLVASSTAANADDHAEIISPAEGEVIYGDTLSLVAIDPNVPEDNDVDDVHWAVVSDDETQDFDACYGEIHFNRVINAGQYSYDGGEFSIELDIEDLEEGEYCFIFNTELENPDSGSRIWNHFSISNDPLAEFDDVATCSGEDLDDECLVETGNVTASTEAGAKEGETARIGIRKAQGAVGGAIDDACEGLLSGHERLEGETTQLLPLGFEEGSITVTKLIEREDINNGVPRGNPHFQVCVAPGVDEADSYGEGLAGITYDDDENDETPEVDTGFVGPILLDDCEGDEDTACIESRHRVKGADLEITYRLPTADPMLR